MLRKLLSLLLSLLANRLPSRRGRANRAETLDTEQAPRPPSTPGAAAQQTDPATERATPIRHAKSPSADAAQAKELPAHSFLDHLNNRNALRDAWIVREVLDKPLALRRR